MDTTRTIEHARDPLAPGYIPSRCPVCGSRPTAVTTHISSNEYYRAVVCSECDIRSHTRVVANLLEDLREKAENWRPWEALVARFPAIMRIHPGDIFKWADNYLARVVKRDLKGGDVRLIFEICGYSPDSREHKEGKVFGESDMEYGCFHEIHDTAEIELFPWDLDVSECMTVTIPESAKSPMFRDEC